MEPSVNTITIITSTLNCAASFAATADSIRNQTCRTAQWIVADGGSTDGTVDLIRQNTDVSRWFSQPDSGIYDAWNRALDHARGEYVCFLGADDALHSPDTLSGLIAAIGNGGYDLVTGRGRLIVANGKSHEFGNPWSHRKLMRRMTICHPGALHHRDLFQRFGKFDTSYRICADYDFLLRLPSDLRTLHVDRVVADIADGGISRDRRWLMLRERYRAQANCPRVGRARAALNYIDKLWRIPVAWALGIPN